MEDKIISSPTVQPLAKSDTKNIYNKVISYSKNDCVDTNYLVVDWLIDILRLAEYGLKHPKSKKGVYAIRRLDITANFIDPKIFENDKLQKFVEGSLGHSSCANTVKGYLHVSEGDIEIGKSYFIKASSGELGVINSSALCCIGGLYKKSYDSDRNSNDIEKAVEYYKLATSFDKEEFNCVHAMFSLANIYDDTYIEYLEGGKYYDKEESIKLLKRGKKLSDLYSVNRLAVLHMCDISIYLQRDLSKTIKNFEFVIEKTLKDPIFYDNPCGIRAMDELGLLYSGKDYGKDYGKAFHFFNMAHVKGKGNSYWTIIGTINIVNLIQEKKIISNIPNLEPFILDKLYDRILVFYEPNKMLPLEGESFQIYKEEKENNINKMDNSMNEMDVNIFELTNFLIPSNKARD